MEGPAFSTRAESHMYRTFGVSVIGMTNLTEAKLAREAEICYGVIALSTDYDCWHAAHEDVSIEAVLAIIRNNVATAKNIIRETIGRIKGKARTCPCADALKYAVISDRSVIPVETRENLALIFGRYLK
jgi:5'-methylthioadenosine phosphorylase